MNFKLWLEEQQSMGHQMPAYHRMHDINHLSMKFTPGMGDHYGPGLYCTFDLKSQFTPYMQRYGDVLVRYIVNIDRFVILDYDIAKKVFGTDYRLSDQLRKFGIRSLKNQKNLLTVRNFPQLVEELQKLAKQDPFNEFVISSAVMASGQSLEGLLRSNPKEFANVEEEDLKMFIEQFQRPAFAVLLQGVSVPMYIHSDFPMPDFGILMNDEEEKKKYLEKINDALDRVKNVLYLFRMNRFKVASADVADFDKKLEKGGYTSDVASELVSAGLNTEMNGLMFSGSNDGRVCVIYKPNEVARFYGWVNAPVKNGMPPTLKWNLSFFGAESPLPLVLQRLPAKRATEGSETAGSPLG